MAKKSVSQIRLVMVIAYLLLCACGPGEHEAMEAANRAVYEFGALETEGGYSMVRFVEASDAAMNELGYMKAGGMEENSESRLKYQSPDGMDIQITVSGFSEFTRIKIRYGLLGDEAQSRRILKEIYLKLLAK